ncbi:hypothetical protein PspLS_08793 [Pyricularia sp. CBS 133598]|nr:hypothetical protein PspLS_08793 [Pyricularia sp. CBS 133598]
MSLGATYGRGEDYKITPISHVTMDPETYGYDRDPWISTTSNLDSALEHIRRRALGNTWYIYKINTSGLYKIIDMKQEYEQAGISYTRFHEQEFVVAHRIVWDHVDGWTTVEPNGKKTYTPKTWASRF